MFRTNRPVSADGFFNREQELGILKRTAPSLLKNEPVWYALIGPRKVGKTSLLLEVKRQLAKKRLRFVLLDSNDDATLSLELFKLYGLRVLDALFSREIGASLEVLASTPPQYRAVLQRSKTFLSITGELRAHILEFAERKPDLSLVRDAIDLPETLAEALGTHVWVMWDEFQQVASIKHANKKLELLPLIRSRWQHHRRVAYTIAGSERSLMLELTTAEHSPFFQHFSLLEIGDIPQQAALSLIQTSSEALGRKIPADLARQMVELVGGHPFYLQLLGEALCMRHHSYDDRSLKAAISELLFSNTGRLSLYFENVYRGLVGRSSQLAKTMHTLSVQPSSLAQVARATGASTGTTSHNLRRLGDAIQRNADGTFRITDRLFGQWIQWRQPGGTVIPMTLVGTEAELAVARSLALMGFELVYQSRASRGAFDLLAIRGSLQLGIQVKRTSLPVSFSKTAWQRMQSDAERFGWHWIVAVLTPEPESELHLLDPEKATRRKTVSLSQHAAIDNLLKRFS